VPLDPRDDFHVFTEREQMFYNLPDPFGQIRDEVQAGLRRQVPDAEVDKIEAYDEPKFVTAGREINGGRKLVITAFAFVFRARVTVRSLAGTREDRLDMSVTMMFGRLDRPGEQVSRTFFDMHADAARNFNDEILKQRFVEFHETDASELPAS